MNTLSRKAFAQRHRLVKNERAAGSFRCRPRHYLGLFAGTGDLPFVDCPVVDRIKFDDAPALASKLGLVYLAAPYASSDKLLEAKRSEAITWVAAELARLGLKVYSPITHFRPMARIEGFPANVTFFDKISTDFLARCDTLVVLLLDGWRQSHGVEVEIREAIKTKTPIYFLEVR